MTATTGVYFRREDYASFWVRALVDVIDFFILGVFCAGLAIVMLMIFPPDRATVYLILLAFSAAGNLYFVVLKHSRLRTLGYRVGRVRIVGLDGNPPSYNSLVWRWLFGLLGPLNWLDSIWLCNDKHRQALRDKFAGTYVVKTDARPAGEGRIVFRLYEIALYNFMFREVQVEATHVSKLSRRAE
jgi:uncharacterized RDD family membrane protein YckC